MRATSLARLLDKQGCPDEAGTLLPEIYDRFTEGFDTLPTTVAKIGAVKAMKLA